MRNNTTAGFTLIELLMVISIISVLASVSLVVGNQARITARNAQRNQIVQAYRVALDLAYDATGSFPSTLSYPGVQACLGKYPVGGKCWVGLFSPQPAIDALVNPYVPAPTPMPSIAGDTRNGLVYYSPYSPSGTDYCVAWMLEGINRSCAPGRQVSANSLGNTYCVFERVQSKPLGC